MDVMTNAPEFGTATTDLPRRNAPRRTVLRPRAIAAALVALVPMLAGSFTAGAAPEPVPGAPGPATQQGWIVRYKAPNHGRQVSQLARAKSHRVTHEFKALDAMALQATAAEARALARDPRVASVTPVTTVRAAGLQGQPGWALDRIDQRTGKDSVFSSVRTGKGVGIYFFDSGINAAHTDFTGRIAAGTNTTGDGSMADGFGHGTHVAGLAAGTRHGVAKQATIVPVKVLGSDGTGSSLTVLKGIDWVLAHHRDGTRAVANMSLVSDSVDEGIEAGVQKMIAEGITVVAAAGNAAMDACQVSPSRMPAVVTVGAVADSSTLLPRWQFSNHGRCVDLFAPGVNVLSASSTSTTGERTDSGTSMATPLVAGTAALVLQQRSNWKPAQVRAFLAQHATQGQVGNPGGSPNRLLMTSSRITPALVQRAPSPVVSGTATVGSTLTATVGAWGSGQVRTSLQWQRSSASGWEPIGGATSTKYVLTSADKGHRVRLKVTGRKVDHRATVRFSTPTASVA